MKAARQLGVIFLLLVWSLMPTMVCALPTVQMTAQERDCCLDMKQECGNMRMPVSHSCCQKSLQSVLAEAAKTHSFAPRPWVGMVIHLPAAELANQSVVASASFKHPDVSPPLSPASSISI